jgi:hypothetical protein
MGHKYNPITLEAEIELFEGTEELKQEVASIVPFPKNKTPDMLFFSGIFVSSGENLNKAFFLPSELVKAHKTINNKALDIEHDETKIVGHIYSSVFIDRDKQKLDISTLQDMTSEELEKMDIDVMIAGIIYKSRFPELADEVQNNKWKLSMETYFQDFDVKIGDLILSKKEAEALGLASENALGRVAKILNKGKEIAKGEVARVLRNLLFSGCGLVKNPANPRSIILETAKKKGIEKESLDDLVVELDSMEEEEGDMSNKDKADVGVSTSPADVSGGPGVDDIRTQTSPGICVNYKKRLIDATYEGPDVKVLHENWCTLYDTGCTSPSRGADNPECIRHKIIEVTMDYTKHKLADMQAVDQRGNLLARLRNLLD